MLASLLGRPPAPRAVPLGRRHPDLSLSRDRWRSCTTSSLRHFDLEPGAEVAIEVDPRVTSFEQVDLLHRLGFNRLSMGVQDFTPEVQEAVNRVQSEEETRALFEHARTRGFESINVDLIYGLPRQTLGVVPAVGRRGDRPATRPRGRLLLRPRALDPRQPEGDSRRRASRAGAEARPLRGRPRAVPGGRLRSHRHGPLRPARGRARGRPPARGPSTATSWATRCKTATDMLGVGVSAIGDVAGAFAQNAKKLPTYYEAIDAGRFPVERGYRLDADDHLRRHVITQLMCNFHLDFGGRGPALRRRLRRLLRPRARGGPPRAHGRRVRGDGRREPHPHPDREALRPQREHDLRSPPAREGPGRATARPSSPARSEGPWGRRGSSSSTSAGPTPWPTSSPSSSTSSPIATSSSCPSDRGCSRSSPD